MRVWIDLTNSPHVLVMRPVIEVLRARGAQVRVTARDFAQTVALCRRFGIDHEVIGRHRGGRLAAKALGLADRSLALTRWARRQGGFDLALGHGSNDVTVAARLLRIPCSTMFDYEWATVQHNVNCRLAQAVVVPEAIPPERLDRYGARRKLRRYAGLKEEYYLADFEPDPAVLAELGLDAGQPIAVVRTPPSVSLYHRFENDLFAAVLQRLRGTQTVVLPRVAAARRLHRARASHRRPVADRARRPGDQRRRHHESRGGGPRHAGVDDVRGPPGRGRRPPDRRGPAAAPRAPRAARSRQARAGRGRRARAARSGAARRPALLARRLSARLKALRRRADEMGDPSPPALRAP
jgi:hypothetical protein